MKKQLLFSLMLSFILLPGLALAQNDSIKSEIPVPTLYNELSADLEIVPISINEEVPVPVLINATPVLYIDPVSTTSYEVNNAYDAFQIMQKYALGINQNDFERFVKEVPSKLSGRILLNVEDGGKAYIVDYKNSELIYLGRPDNALEVFRNFNIQIITGQKWKWVSTEMNNDESIIPTKPEVFSITFHEDGKLNGTTDCNNFFGQYEKSEDSLILGPIGSTRMYCEGSQELEFTSSLSEVDKFMFNEEGNLILLLKYDSGSIIFE